MSKITINSTTINPNKTLYRINAFFTRRTPHHETGKMKEVGTLFVQADTPQKAEEIAIKRVINIIIKDPGLNVSYSLRITKSSKEELDEFLTNKKENGLSSCGVIN